MLPERGAGLGLGSNYGLRCPLARAGDPYGEAPAQAERRGTAAAAPPLERAPCLPPHVCTRLERVEAAARRQRGRIGGGIEPRRQDAQVSTELAGEGGWEKNMKTWRICAMERREALRRMMMMVVVDGDVMASRT